MLKTKYMFSCMGFAITETETGIENESDTLISLLPVKPKLTIPASGP